MKQKNKQQQLNFLRNLKDEDIDFSDDAEISADEIKSIKPNSLFYKVKKTKMNISIDMDIVAWLRTQKNASKLINELLKKEILKLSH